MRHFSLVCSSLTVALALSATVGAAELDLEVGALRSGPELSARMDAKVRDFARNVAQATSAQRERLQRIGRWNSVAPFSLPTTLYLTSNGRRLGPSPLLRGGGGSITLAFDDTGPRSFPPTYKQTLIDTFRKLSRGSYASGLGALYAYESQLPAIARNVPPIPMPSRTLLARIAYSPSSQYPAMPAAPNNARLA